MNLFRFGQENFIGLKAQRSYYISASLGCWSIGHLFTLLAFWAQYSYPITQLTFSITAPDHPEGTRVAMYLALFSYFSLCIFLEG